jgi:DNA-binding SARP family transcriptional activator
MRFRSGCTPATRRLASPRVEFRILGPLEVDGVDGPVALSGSKQRALLAILLLHANQVVDSARLIDALWSDGPPADAPKALQIHVSRLRRTLAPEEVVQTRPGGYLVAADANNLDLPRFEQLTSEGRSLLAASNADGARAALVEALALWRGAPLAEFAAEPFAQAEMARLEALHAGALEARVDADLALGAHNALVPELEAVVARYPLREHLRGQLMLALYRSGRQAEALQAYRDARGALVEELGIEPGRKLQELEQAILRQDASLDLDTRRARPGRRAAGVFVGRDREVDELSAALDDAAAGRGRLFLVSGESGLGKTRLADEVASRAKDAGLRVLWGRSAKSEGAPAYWLWSQALRPLDAELPELEPAKAEGQRFQLFVDVASALRSASAVQPVFLVLDDLQHADEPSLLLLDFLAGELAEMHLAVLGTYAEDDAMPKPLAALAEHSGHHLLRLRPLGVGDVALLLERAGAADADAAGIHTDTGGNPRRVWQRVR